MDKKFLGVIAGIIVVIAIGSLILSSLDTETLTKQQTNEKIGLVINSPNQATTLQELDQIYSEASDTGIGRSNVYLFWNLIEPVRGEFDWSQSDILMGFNEKNNFKVTLFFSVVNGDSLGPFPDWIGRPTINSIGEDRLVSVLDAILSRYHIVDSVVISGETESQFRYSEENIPVYKELFSKVYDKLKDKHPDVKFGNSFALHQVLNKDLQNIVNELVIGDFVAFSYFPVDNLNDIVKTPDDAIEDLKKAFEIVPDKKIAFFEVSWSSSDFVGGDTVSQQSFLEKIFNFYSDNEPEIEFLTWYRYSDRPEGTCVAEQQEIGEESISVGGGSGLGSSEFTIERLNYYICNAGLITVDGSQKLGWNEFKKQIEMLN